MKIEEKERVFGFRDASPDAIRRRLIAARSLVSSSQKEFAEMLEIPHQTYNSQEIKAKPRREVFDYLYRNARVGPNFILYGEFLPLPGDVQIALLNALLSEGLDQAKRPAAD